MKLEFHPEAELELIEAATYYERQVPGLGERFGTEVRSAIDLLLDAKDIGHQSRRPGYWRQRFDR